VFYENNQQAVIDHTWSARADQLTKRQACKLFYYAKFEISGELTIIQVTPTNLIQDLLKEVAVSSAINAKSPGTLLIKSLELEQLALATYIDPGANVATWERLISFPSDKVSVLVANVVNGPDSAANAGWTDVIPRAAASGKTVLGYVRTGYLGVSFQKFTTRLGSSHTSDWYVTQGCNPICRLKQQTDSIPSLCRVAQIQEDVDQWYRLYPGHIGGIFFDEGWNDCGAGDLNAKLYKFITQETKRKYPGAYTVLNPGAPMPQCFEHSADTLLTAEVSYATYTSSAYADVDWTPSDPRKLWHIVYDVPSDQVAAVAKLARSRNVGMLHITDDIEPNPYDTIPDDEYMQNFMDAVEGGQTLNEALALYTGSVKRVDSPLRFQVDQFDYSSATLSWLVTSEAIGYRIRQDGVPILSLMPWMTVVTVGNLEPGTSYTFSIVAISAGGMESGLSQLATVKTLALPHKGRTVADTSVSATASQTTYKAKILVPYAFVRIFIWSDHHSPSAKCNLAIYGGWPINYTDWDYVCNYYMVEGGTLYKYSGSGANWSWTWVAEVSLVQTGYDYVWNVPLGLSTISTHNFILQVQGYGPMANVFHPCPEFGVESVSFSKAATYCS